MLLTYGSRGSSVSELQTKLNQSGYGLAVDGIYGAKTQAAVRDYQSKNGLSADGIAGELTFGKLNTQAASPAAAAPSTAAEEKKDLAGWYTPSDQVEQYKKQLEQAIGKKPGEFSSDYKDQMDAIYQKIMGRDKFSYDLNSDALYQQYREQYQTLGQQAMEDTMGQAAGLTGGYGSTYSQNAGQQAYQGYIQQLNDKVPQLYAQAREQYNQEGTDLSNQLSAAQGMYADDYSKYRDQVSDWENDRSYAQDQYDNERSFDYSAQETGWNRENTLSDKEKDQAYSEAENMISAGLMPDDALLEKSGMSKSYARQMVAAMLAQAASGGSSGSSGGGGGSSSSGSGRANGLSSFEQMQVDKGKATVSTAKSRFTNRDTQFSNGELKNFKYQIDRCRTDAGKRALVADAYDEGKISDAQYTAYCKQYGWTY